MEDNRVEITEEDFINVKLEKHLWPDEIKSRRRRRIVAMLMVVGLIFSYAFGWATGRVNTRNTNNTGIVSNNNNNQPPFKNQVQEQDSSELNVDQQFSKFQYIYEILTNNWYFSKEMGNPASQIMDHAIEGMIEKNGDIHTSYMSAEELKDFEEGINQNFVGIGVQYYQVDGYSIVLKVFNNSPAERAGVQPGDIFMKVDGVDVVDMPTSELSERVKGEENTVVTIVFERNDELVELDITRAPITSTTFAKLLEDGIGYLEINSFGTSTPDEIREELQMLINQGMTKLVIDVRDNGGGYLSALNQIASFFLEPNSVVMAQEDVDGNINKTYSTNDKFDEIEKIVMLINQNSASAAEVLALSLRDNLGVELVGTKTYGKGTVQTTLPLADGSALKYTIAQWLSPNGDRIHHEGVNPTIEVKIHEVFHVETPTLEDGEIIKVDEVHNALVYVQNALDFLGFNPDRVDGYYSEKTLEAYHKYQETYQLDKSDEITRETISQLSSRVYQKFNQQSQELDLQLEKALELLR